MKEHIVCSHGNLAVDFKQMIKILQVVVGEYGRCMYDFLDKVHFVIPANWLHFNHTPSSNQHSVEKSGFN